MNFQETDSYVLYIGTNDKDTNKPEISFQDSQNIVDEISRKYTDGFTSVSASGNWNSPENVWFSEDTLIYIYYELSEEQVMGIADEVIIALNQESILIEHGIKQTAYYPPEP